MRMRTAFEGGIGREYYDTNPRLKELLKYKYLQSGDHLEELEELIVRELEKINPNSYRYKNLQGMLPKIRTAIMESQFKQIHSEGNIKELIKNYIFENGFKGKDILIKEIERNKIIKKDSLKLMKIDLMNKDFIFYIEADDCRVRTVARILAGWQYFLDKEDKKYNFIVIAPDFNYQYFLAIKAIEPLNINISNYDFIIERDKIIFKKLLPQVLGPSTLYK